MHQYGDERTKKELDCLSCTYIQMYQMNFAAENFILFLLVTLFIKYQIAVVNKTYFRTCFLLLIFILDSVIRHKSKWNFQHGCAFIFIVLLNCLQ